jgi:hypothetical protein
MKLIKDLVRRIVGEGNQGRLDFFRHPDMQYGQGGPFNGQKFRLRVFFDLLYYFPIKAIVETGTFRGTTTALFGATSLPVYTVEINPRYFSYAKMRFRFNRANIHLYRNDSRSFLKSLSEDSSVPKEDVFFYLDAHWGKDLPLRDELEIIFSKWRRPIVMIDDFQVPNSDYENDDYGPGKVLDLSYIDPVVSAHKLAVFFPAENSSAETGARRGSVVLCQEMSGFEVDTKITTLIRDTSYRQRIVEE